MHLDELAQGRPEGQFEDAFAANVPGDGEEHRSGGRVRPHRSEPVGAARDDRRHVGERFDVVDERWIRRRAVPERSLHERTDLPREGAASLHHADEPGLFTEEVTIGSVHELDPDRADRARFAHLLDRTHEVFGFQGEGLLQADVGASSADGLRGDHQAFEHRVRVPPQEEAILERGRFSLRSVADDEPLR